MLSIQKKQLGKGKEGCGVTGVRDFKCCVLGDIGMTISSAIPRLESAGRSVVATGHALYLHQGLVGDGRSAGYRKDEYIFT